MKLRSLMAVVTVAPLLVACAAGPGPITQADRDAIAALRTAYQQSILAGDAAAMLAVYADDVVEMPPNMRLRSGKAAAEAAASADTSPQPSTFSLTSAETEGVGDLAYDRGSYSFSMSMEGMPEPMTDTGKYIVLLRKQADGSWLMTATIWNSDLPIPDQQM